jgi:hypothetical protein
VFSNKTYQIKFGFKTGILVLEFLNAEKPVLKKDTGFEGPSWDVAFIFQLITSLLL